MAALAFDHNFPSTKLELDLLSSFNLVVLFPVSQTNFQMLSKKPLWLDLLGHCTSSNQLVLNQPEGYLENFLIDAKKFWLSKAKGTLLSGKWVHIDAQGAECPFQALATRFKGNPVVLVQLITETYLEVGRILQSARESVIKQEKVERLIHQDCLTGLYNRRGFLAHAEQQMLFARINQLPVTVACIDLDRLKLVNDRYGHKAGDQMIIDAAALFKKIFRKVDILGRVGGDEFLALMVNMDNEQTTHFHARLRHTVNEWNTRQEPQFKISFSIGLASDNAEPQSLEFLVNLAGANMYKNKRDKKQKQMAACSPAGMPE